MSENLLAPLFVVWLIGAGRLVEASKSRAGAPRGRRGQRLWSRVVRRPRAHDRRRRAVARVGCRAGRCTTALVVGSGGAVVSTGVGLFAVRALDHFLITTSYGGHPPDEAGNRLSSLQHLDSAASVLRNTAGQTWYVLVATLALPLVVLSAGDLRGRLARLRQGPSSFRSSWACCLPRPAACSRSPRCRSQTPNAPTVHLRALRRDRGSTVARARGRLARRDGPTSEGDSGPWGDRARNRHRSLAAQTFTLRAHRTAGTSPGCLPRRSSSTASSLVVAG